MNRFIREYDEVWASFEGIELPNTFGTAGYRKFKLTKPLSGETMHLAAGVELTIFHLDVREES